MRNDELPWERARRAGRRQHRDLARARAGPSTRATSASRWTRCATPSVPVLGVCLGHQALAHVAGGTVEHAREVMHGRLSAIHHDESALFAGIPQGSWPSATTRWSSARCRDELRVTAWTPDGVVMALEHRAGRSTACSSTPSPSPRATGAALIENFRDLTPAGGAAAARDGPRAAAPRGRRRAPCTTARLNAWCEPETAFRALYADQPHAVWLDSARTGRASGASPTSARRTGRTARSSATTSAREHRVVDRADRPRGQAESVLDYCRRELRACARTRPSCRSTSSAASPATWAGSSRRSAVPRSRTARRCPTPRSCCATACSRSTTASARIHLVALADDGWLDGGPSRDRPARARARADAAPARAAGARRLRFELHDAPATYLANIGPPSARSSRGRATRSA